MSQTPKSLIGEPLFSPNDIARLFQVLADVADRSQLGPAELIERLEQGVMTPSRLPAAVGGLLFRDPAWDMLLDLFASHERGHRVSVSARCYASGVPQTTALRTVQRLEEQGMIVREGDPNDLRRSWVRTSPEVLSGIATMAGLFAEAVLASADATKPAMVKPLRLSEADLKRFFSDWRNAAHVPPAHRIAALY